MTKPEKDHERIVGILLGDARQAAGFSQPEAARRVGMSQSRLAQVELGNRRLRLTEAFTFADLYGIELADLDPRGRALPRGPRRRRARVDRSPRASDRPERAPPA